MEPTSRKFATATNKIAEVSNREKTDTVHCLNNLIDTIAFINYLYVELF